MSKAVLNPLEFTDMTSAQVQLVKDTICKGATDDELSLFLYTSTRTKLDPFAKQCWAVRRWNKTLGRMELTFQTSIDGFRVIAQRSGDYEGQDGPYWCGEDGKWTDIWLSSKPPVAAKVGVYRKGFKLPIYGIAKYDSYVQKTKNGQVTQMWANLADHMVAKISEALALRKAFPNDLSGVLSEDEVNPEGDEIQTAQPTERDVKHMNAMIEKTNPAAVESKPLERHPPSSPEIKPIVNHAPTEPVVDLDAYKLKFNFGTFRMGKTFKQLGMADTKKLQTSIMSYCLKQDSEGKEVPAPLKEFIELSTKWIGYQKDFLNE